MYAYPVTLTQDGDSVLLTFADVPEAVTFGEDEAEALLQGQDALETALEMYIDDRRALPAPSPAEGRPLVAPSALAQAKLGLYDSMRQQHIKKAELARRLGWHMPQVDRVLDLQHASQFKQIEQAASALGRHINVSMG